MRSHISRSSSRYDEFDLNPVCPSPVPFRLRHRAVISLAAHREVTGNKSKVNFEWSGIFALCRKTRAEFPKAAESVKSFVCQIEFLNVFFGPKQTKPKTNTEILTRIQNKQDTVSQFHISEFHIYICNQLISAAITAWLIYHSASNRNVSFLLWLVIRKQVSDGKLTKVNTLTCSFVDWAGIWTDIKYLCQLGSDINTFQANQKWVFTQVEVTKPGSAPLGPSLTAGRG